MKASTCCGASPHRTYGFDICGICKEHADFEDQDCVYCPQCGKTEVSEPGEKCGQCKVEEAEVMRELATNR